MAALDKNQNIASRAKKNTVIAAGAGSGKTRVLAARFVHLIVEKKILVDRILTLTFTKKAASEMYTRIYSTLRSIDDPRAKEAIASFHLARIDTIDAFCNSIARNACRNYGISPDFEIDNDRASLMAEELALPFFLENRTSSAIRQFMKRYSLAELPTALFADTMVRHSPVSSPLDFTQFREIQKREIAELFPKTTEAIIRAMYALKALPETKGKTAAQVASCLTSIPEMPEISDARSITSFISFCEKMNAIGLPGQAKDPTLVMLKEILSEFKKRQYPLILSLANAVLNDECIEETFRLLAEFQTLFHQKKREAGILTFADVSRLAVDALEGDCLLRASYKNAIDAIMIDEFQDDNELQRNMLFLIAEKPERITLSVPKPEELCPDKLFFVGDEKQSIYRFRGADVSVFRKLASDLSCENAISLSTNYRTESALISVFNTVFPLVFADPSHYPENSFPLHEASFSPIGASQHTDGVESALDVLLVNECNFDDNDGDFYDAGETEASEVAVRIAELVKTKTPIRGIEGLSPCKYDDIAILFRSGTKQRFFEKHLREHGIPYQTESLRGLFSDAPINDMYALLRLAVYPADKTAYAIVLRSPFVTLGDRGFTLAMMQTEAEGVGTSICEPFSIETDPLLEKADLERFRQGRTLYLDVQGKADRMPAADLISHLWYTLGYRYAVLSDPKLHRYAELYDYFFELARLADKKGETLATFLDRIAKVMQTGEKIEGLDIPVERSGGVHLMTVHKSKGLEFPVVFLVDCGNPGNTDKNIAPVFYSEKSGISVNTGEAEDAENAKSNYFYEKNKEEEKSKTQAEIRRLLYVAMTRAETRLFISGAFKAKAEPTDTGRDEDALRAIINEWLDTKDESAQKKGKQVSKQSFFDYLLPALSLGPISGLRIHEILPHHRKTGSKIAQTELFPELDDPLEAFHETAPLADYPSPPRIKFSATGLHELHLEENEEIQVNTERSESSSPEMDALEKLLKNTGISSVDFGTFTHKTIEGRFTGFPSYMPEELRADAEKMADRFLSSKLGKMAQNATWRENEFGFITRYIYNGTNLIITGQIDLVFEYKGITYIVDYKTDKIENPNIHAEQLAVYRKAVQDLYKKETETWLYYLRSGHETQVKKNEKPDTSD